MGDVTKGGRVLGDGRPVELAVARLRSQQAKLFSNITQQEGDILEWQWNAQKTRKSIDQLREQHDALEDEIQQILNPPPPEPEEGEDPPQEGDSG